MTRIFFLTVLAMMVGVTDVRADNIVLSPDGHTVKIDRRTESQIRNAQEALEDARHDRDKTTVFYNRDDGFSIGRGSPLYVPRYNYNQYTASPLSNQVAEVCGGLRERKYKRCAEDVIEEREKLIKKHRN